MKIGKQSLSLVSGIGLLLGGLAGEAFSSAQVYRAKLLCVGETRGTAQIGTLTKRSGGGLSEPFFKVIVHLTHLPELPLEKCEVALSCQDAGEIAFDCAADVKPHTMAFSADRFLGELPSLPCHQPAVTVAITYTGGAISCSPGF